MINLRAAHPAWRYIYIYIVYIYCIYIYIVYIYIVYIYIVYIYILYIYILYIYILYIYIYIVYIYTYIFGASGFAAHMVPECNSFFLRFILSMDPKDWCDWVPQRFCRWDDFEKREQWCLRARLLSYTRMPLLNFNFWDTNMATNTKEQSPFTESDAINTWSINQRFGNHARYSIPVKYINRSDVRVSSRIQSHVYLARIAATSTSPSPRNTGAYDGGLLQGENGRASTCNEEDLGPTEIRSIGQGPIVWFV